MIFIYDYDDRNMIGVVNEVKKKTSVKEFLLNRKDKNIEVLHSESDLILKQNETIITADDFCSSDAIIFFRWKMKEQPFVGSSLTKSHDRQFAEREWNSLLWGLLCHLEQYTAKVTWINSPSRIPLYTNKYYLLCSARCFRFSVPKFAVSNRFFNVNPNSEYMVAKSISSDEQIDKQRYFRTAKLDKNFINAHLGLLSVCPSFLQEYIKPDFELRIYYLLGSTYTVKLSAEVNYEDIRQLDSKDLAVESYNCPSELTSMIDSFCRCHQINYCSFDFAIKGGQCMLLDITPNGSWFFYHNSVSSEITNWFAEQLLNLSSGNSK